MRTYDKNRNNYPRVGLLSPNQIEAPMSARLQSMRSSLIFSLKNLLNTEFKCLRKENNIFLDVNFDKLSGFGTEDTSFDEMYISFSDQNLFLLVTVS